MTHAVRIVASVAVLVALALCVPVQAQTPEIDELRVCWESSDTLSQDAHVDDVTRPASTVARAVGLR